MSEAAMEDPLERIQGYNRNVQADINLKWCSVSSAIKQDLYRKNKSRRIPKG